MKKQHHIQGISAARPAVAQDIPPDVKLVFLRDVIDAAIPLFENTKNVNPADSSGGGDTTT